MCALSGMIGFYFYALDKENEFRSAGRVSAISRRSSTKYLARSRIHLTFPRIMRRTSIDVHYVTVRIFIIYQAFIYFASWLGVKTYRARNGWNLCHS